MMKLARSQYLETVVATHFSDRPPPRYRSTRSSNRSAFVEMLKSSRPTDADLRAAGLARMSDERLHPDLRIDHTRRPRCPRHSIEQ